MPVVDDLGLNPEMPRKESGAADPDNDVSCAVHRMAEYTQRLSHASTKCGSPFTAKIHTLFAPDELPAGSLLVMEIAQRLRIVCTALNKQATTLAEEIGVSPQAFNNYVTGDRPVRVDAMIRLANLYGVPLDYIYRGSFDGMTTMMAATIRKAEAAFSESVSQSPDGE